MSAASLRRLVPVGWKGDVRALVDRLAERHAFEASASQRAEIARRAEACLASPVLDEDEVRGLAFDVLTAPSWKARALAAARLSASGASAPWEVVGSLGTRLSGEAAPRDDAHLASAVAVAARETFDPDLAAAHDRLRGPAAAALVHEGDGGRHWDEAARPLLSVFAANARAAGADRRAAALRVLAAAAHLKGEVLRPGSSEPFLLAAAAASVLVPKDEARADGAPSPLEALAAALAALNDARAAVWEEADDETHRLMGAAAALAAFGRGTVSVPSPHAYARPQASALVPRDVLARFGALTAAEASAALDEEASDPRLDAARRRRLEAIADSLRRHRAPHAVSCAEALGTEVAAAAGAPRPGMRLYRVAQRGRGLVCEGKGGRAVRCRPVAGSDGAHAGYLAFDALSREFGGRPLYAVYAPDGARYGYAFADGDRPIVRRGAPEQGFITAPARIPV